jgi:hypothetical protein
MYSLPGTRITLPQMPLAVLCILVGVVLITLGVLCTRKIRAHMWATQTEPVEMAFNLIRKTQPYLIHEYDEPDKWLMMLGYVGRYPGGLLLLWGIAGIALR